MIDSDHYTSLVEIDGWLSACVINDDGVTYLSVFKSLKLTADHPDYKPVRDELARRTWRQTSYDQLPDEDTVGGVAEELIYRLVSLN